MVPTMGSVRGMPFSVIRQTIVAFLAIAQVIALSITSHILASRTQKIRLVSAEHGFQEAF